MNRQVLIISTEYPPGPGGIGQHAYSLSRALHTEGFVIKVLSPADYASPAEVLLFDQSQPFEVMRYQRRGLLLTYINRLTLTHEAIRDGRCSSVILTGKFSLWQGLMIKKFYPNIKTIAVLHGTEINLPNRYLRKFTHKAIAAADVIVPVSRFTKSLLPEWIRHKHPNIHIIPNGIEDTLPSAIPNTDIILNGNPRLLTIGHVSPRKGQHRVIKALPKMVAVWPKIHYHIVGRPKNQAILEVLAQQLGVQNHITFHGRVADHRDLRIYYSQADIFMLLSENQPDGDVEGFGIVALEANVQGVPVVGAKYCGVEEAVDHKQSGYLVDGDNSEEIIEGVGYCLANRENLNKGAVEWAHAHQWRTIVQQYIALFD
jgi:phosphatidylinositol alpha-1,6-mannosyltransferase